MRKTMIAETDRRLPSGEWSGFYIERLKPRRGWMHLYIQFSDGRIQGEGTDYVGPWHLSGTYDLATCTCDWVKQYVGKHQVIYEGTVDENGIQGQWTISEVYSGPFHIWPRERQDLYELYQQDDLELDWPTIHLSPQLDLNPDAGVQFGGSSFENQAFYGRNRKIPFHRTS